MHKIALRMRWFYFFLPVLFFLNLNKSYAQQRLSLKDIPSLVQTNLPKLNTIKADAEASKSLIDYEKRGLMPDLTVAYQANLATFNNITGMSYPGLVMPISGPVNNDIIFVPGSAATAFLTWRPITFGQRGAAIDRATAQFKLANTKYDEQAFRYQFMAINAYLDAVYFQQLISSNKASISRYTSSLEQSLILAKNGLKPGVDTIQLQSSIAQAEIGLLQSENNYKQKLLELSSLIGDTARGGNLLLADTTFYAVANLGIDTALNSSSHPYYIAAHAKKEVTAAQLDEVNKSWRPKLDIWGNVYGRGKAIFR